MVFDSRAVRLRIPQEKVRIRLDELMTFAGLILWVLQAYIDDSGFGTIFGTELGKLIRYFCLLLFLARILLSDMHFAARAVSAAAVFFCYLMMIQQMSGAGIKFLQLFVMMMAVKDLSFKRICKVMFWSCLFCYLGILFFDRIGLIWRPPLIDGDRVRDYMGFRFVSFPSIYIFNLFFCGAYAYTDPIETARTKRRNRQYVQRVPLPALAALEALNVLVYLRTNTNIPFLITSFFVLLYLITAYGDVDLFPDRVWMRFLAGICYPALAFFAYEVVSHYNPNSKKWLKIDDKLTHFRIRHAAEGLKRYGIRPLSQIVYQNGDLQSPNYFYIDSAYMKVLINYGLIFAVILFGIYAMISVAAVRRRDAVLCIWMVCIAGYSLMNNVLMDPEQCCTLFAFWYAVDAFRGGGRPRQRYYDPREPDDPPRTGARLQESDFPAQSGRLPEPDPPRTGAGLQEPDPLHGSARLPGPDFPAQSGKKPEQDPPSLHRKEFEQLAAGTAADDEENAACTVTDDDEQRAAGTETDDEQSAAGTVTDDEKSAAKKPDGPSVKVNFLLSTAYQILIVILPMITAPYLSRVLGPGMKGIYSYTASNQTYFSMFAALGTVSYGSREISRNRKDRAVRSKLFWEIELMTVGTSIVSLAAFILFIVTRDTYRIYYIPQIMAVLAVMFDISWFFTGIEEFRYIVTKNALFKLAGVILIFLLVHGPEDLLVYIVIMSASTMLGNMSMWIHMPRFLERVDPGSLRIRRHLKETMVYFIPSIATTVYTVLDKTLIGVITHDAKENGFYESVVQLINIMKALTFTALNSVLGARISFLYAEKRFEEIRRRIETSINYILFMGLGICFGLSAVAPRFIPWFLGPGYERSIWMLVMMSPIVVIIGVSNCLGSQYYTPAGKRAQSARFIIAGSCTNLVLNLLLIPRYWGYGAIAASLAAELVVTALYVAFSGESFSPSVLLRDGWKKLAAAALMFAAVRLIDPLFAGNFTALAAEVCAGGAVYLLVLFILRDRFMTGFCLDLAKSIVLKRGRRRT